MNSKKRRVTRKRCVRKCKKRTSRKLRGSRHYGGGRTPSMPPSNERENHIREQIDSLKKLIHTYLADDPIRTDIENRILILEMELEEITNYKPGKKRAGDKVTSLIKKPGRSISQHYIQPYIDSFKKSLHTLGYNDPKRPKIENRIQFLKKD